MSARHAGIPILACAWLVLCAAAAEPGLSLGGIAIGTSIADAVKTLGFPDVAESTDYGSFWQWSDRDGLDREVNTDDRLIVESVVISRAGPVSTAQPPEAPMLGLDAAGAAAVALKEGAGPLVTEPSRPRDLVWPLGGGYLAAETDGKTVLNARALDVTFARRYRYAGQPLEAPKRTAVSMVHEAVVHPLPSGRGDDLILVKVDAGGSVTDATIAVSSGDSEVDWWSLKCARTSTFKPATCEGVPCAGTYLFSGGIED